MWLWSIILLYILSLGAEGAVACSSPCAIETLQRVNHVQKITTKFSHWAATVPSWCVWAYH